MCPLPEDSSFGIARIAAQVWEKSPDLIVTIDRAFGLQYSNPAFAQATGLTQLQLFGRHIGDLLGYDSFYTQHQPHFEKCLSGQTRSYDWQIFLPVRGTRYMNFSLTPFHGQDQIIEGIVLLARDVTIENDIRQAMRQKEDRFQHVANHKLVMMYGSDVAGTRNFFNQQWLDFTGRSFDEECQQSWLYRVHPDDLITIAKAYQAGMGTGQPFYLEYRLQRADEEYRWLLEQGATLWSPEGIMDGYLGCAIDITERKLLPT